MIISTLHLVIFGLATWRISSMLVNEKGPLNIFERIRKWAGIQEMRVGDAPEVYKVVPNTFLAQLLDCVWCCSVWAATGIGLGYYFFPALTFWGGFVFAMSALAIAFEKILR